MKISLARFVLWAALVYFIVAAGLDFLLTLNVL